MKPDTQSELQVREHITNVNACYSLIEKSEKVNILASFLSYNVTKIYHTILTCQPDFIFNVKIKLLLHRFGLAMFESPLTRISICYIELVF